MDVPEPVSTTATRISNQQRFARMPNPRIASILLALGLFAGGCTNQSQSADQPSMTTAFVQQLLITAGDDVLQHEGTEALKKHRDGQKFMGLLDGNKDGVVSLAEVEPFLQQPTPESSAAMVVMALAVLRARK